MRFWKSLPGALVLCVTFTVVVGVGALAVRVNEVTRPPRAAENSLPLPELLVKIEPVRFPSSDGIELAGWLLKGKPNKPSIVLCHDLGGSKATLLNLALGLQRAGFTVLALDFRGHGESKGSRSSLGLTEKRDVIGAVDFLAAPGSAAAASHIGVYGAGMGAFAATLAALDRPALRVLVLDGLYPDVEYQISRRVYENWEFGVAHLAALPAAVFGMMRGAGVARECPAEVLPRLAGRALLLLAPAQDASLAAEMERMYKSLPETSDSEGNLVTLPSTQVSGLYGQDLEHYLERVRSFFESRL